MSGLRYADPALPSTVQAHQDEQGTHGTKQSGQPVIDEATVDLRLVRIISIIEDLHLLTGVIVGRTGAERIDKLEVAAACVSIFHNCRIGVVAVTRISPAQVDNRAHGVIRRLEKPFDLSIEVIPEKQKSETEDKENGNGEPVCLQVRFDRGGYTQRICPENLV